MSKGLGQRRESTGKEMRGKAKTRGYERSEGKENTEVVLR